MEWGLRSWIEHYVRMDVTQQGINYARVMPEPGLSGRRAQAARNDDAILAAAREVFVADPDAAVSEVAERAGVGISALYRRYRSKEDLLRKLAGDGLHAYIEIARAAVDADRDRWGAFATFMTRIVEA